MEAEGLNQSQLADAIGMRQPSIGRLLSGDTRQTKSILELARALNTTPEYLTGDSDEPEPNQGAADRRLAFRHADPARSTDLIELPEYDVSYGLGATYIHDVPVTERRHSFSREWIRQFTKSPFDKLFWARGIGHSMAPLLLDSDTVLIDTEQRTPRVDGKIWAIDMHGMGSIKALRAGPNGSMQIISISPDWPNEVAHDGEMQVVGRVVAVMRAM